MINIAVNNIKLVWKVNDVKFGEQNFKGEKI
jgi:hypothetical protein